jgi:hypothetical protein
MVGESERPFVCPLCGERFETQRELKDHGMGHQEGDGEGDERP